MLTIIGSLLGFLGSSIPSILGIMEKKEDNKLQYELMKLQSEITKQGAEIDLTKFKAMAMDNEHARLIEHDIAMQKDTGAISWLRKSVRPVITYMFFALFAAVKISSLYVAMETTGSFNTAIQIVWDPETQGIFAAIISFWFGSRAIEKNVYNKR